MSEIEHRPDPDAMLQEVKKNERGQLRIFLGMAPGVGKTYAMLTEAHQRRQSGKDVLIGWVETHRRSDTEALLKGLTVLARKPMAYAGKTVYELDLDEILKKRPSVVIIDEMPHSNPKGSRHAKRWQDIEEILDAGIDVWTALNIQHLESLNGVVERVTGVAVTETVPDRVFDTADEVRLIDLPPDDLLSRLSAGKIYLPKIVERAKNAYFKRTNLIALRDLALRTMTSRMETQIRSERLRSTRTRVDDTSFGQLLVLDEINEEAVREVARMARVLGTTWRVAWMIEKADEALESETVAKFFRYIEEMGAPVDPLAGDYTREIVRFARDHNLITIAMTSASKLRNAARLAEIKKMAPELHVLFLGKSVRNPRRITAWMQKNLADFQLSGRGYAQSALITAFIGLISFPIRNAIEPTNLAMIYMLGVLMSGVRYGRGPAAFSAVLSVLAFDLTIIDPIMSFNVADTQYLITFTVMLIVGLVAGQLVANRERMAKASNAREHQTRLMLDASKRLSTCLDPQDAIDILSETLERQVLVQIEFWMPKWDDEETRGKNGEAPDLERVKANIKSVDPAIVRWVYEHAQSAGIGTDTLAKSTYWYLPMISAGHVLAVMVVNFPDNAGAINPATRRWIEALASLGAQTLMRINSALEARQTLINMEADRLRYSLIQSLSHDLRTPVTMLKLGAEQLHEKIAARQYPQADELSDKLIDGASRMERLVTNLLEMARLQSGSIELKQTWIPAQELFGSAMAELGERLDAYDVGITIDEGCPLVYGDEVLLVRVLTNLLDNAVKYCEAGDKIHCTARLRGNNLALTVADSGPGLPEGSPQRLFDPFRRGQKEGNISGVGLGLAICRTIARAHEGDIFATPSVLGGAAFTVILPMVPMQDIEDEESVIEQQEKSMTQDNAPAQNNEQPIPSDKDAQ